MDFLESQMDAQDSQQGLPALTGPEFLFFNTVWPLLSGCRLVAASLRSFVGSCPVQSSSQPKTSGGSLHGLLPSIFLLVPCLANTSYFIIPRLPPLTVQLCETTILLGFHLFVP